MKELFFRNVFLMNSDYYRVQSNYRKMSHLYIVVVVFVTLAVVGASIFFIRWIFKIRGTCTCLGLINLKHAKQSGVLRSFALNS